MSSISEDIFDIAGAQAAMLAAMDTRISELEAELAEMRTMLKLRLPPLVLPEAVALAIGEAPLMTSPYSQEFACSRNACKFPQCTLCGCLITAGGVSHCLTRSCPHVTAMEHAVAATQCKECHTPMVYSVGPHTATPTRYPHCGNSECGRYGLDARLEED